MVRLLQSDHLEAPAAMGVFRATIIVPVSLLSRLAPEQLEAVLLHELAHIRRHDYLINLLQTLLEALLFYHPAVWWVSRTVRMEREHCCDDIAVRALGNPILYARALTTLEEERRLVPLPILSARGGNLVNRITRIIGMDPGHAKASPLSVAAAALALATIATVTATQAQAQNAVAKTAPVPAKATTKATKVSLGVKKGKKTEWIIVNTIPKKAVIWHKVGGAHPAPAAAPQVIVVKRKGQPNLMLKVGPAKAAPVPPRVAAPAPAPATHRVGVSIGQNYGLALAPATIAPVAPTAVGPAVAPAPAPVAAVGTATFRQSAGRAPMPAVATATFRRTKAAVAPAAAPPMRGVAFQPALAPAAAPARRSNRLSATARSAPAATAVPRRTGPQQSPVARDANPSDAMPTAAPARSLVAPDAVPPMENDLPTRAMGREQAAGTSVNARAADFAVTILEIARHYNRSFVVEPGSYRVINVVLSNVDFETALQAISRAGNATYRIEKGVYYFEPKDK